MKKHPFSDLFYQLIALMISIIIVHAIYVTIVRPRANTLLEAQAASYAAGKPLEIERSIFVIIKDYEQEACFVLLLWATAICIMKLFRAYQERQLLDRRFIDVIPGQRILPEDARQFLRPLQSLPSGETSLLLPRALRAALDRFGITHNVQDVSGVVREVCETEADRLDSELAMVRYIVWAIPSIGFIGTVRGIGQALGQAHRAVEGDIIGVTVSLGVAFNSTFVALVLSMFIMFLLHQLQLMQERVVLDTQAYCEERLLTHLAVR